MDDIHTAFYQKYCHIISKNICLITTAFLKYSHFLKDVNKTYITLFPKTENLEKVNDYRRISLYTVSYEFIS